jgi:Transmembrane protein 43
MADTFSTVTTTSFFGRIRDALVGFIVGPLLLIGAVILIFWNESHSVRVIKSLKEGAANVVEAQAYDSENDGELVHVTGETASDQTLRDPKFGVTSPGIRLNRNVQVYAWTEKESSSSSTNMSGSKTTKKTYTYDKKWVSSLPKSSHFKEREGHENPTELKYSSDSFQADKVALGSYTLDPELVAKIDKAKSVSLDESSVKLPEGAKLSGDAIYVGADPENPAVGDLRITETVVPTGTVSVVADQGPGGVLTPSETDAGETIALVESGSKSAKEMFATAQSANRTFTWVARLGGFLMLLFGFLLFLGPISTMSSIVPFFGGIVEAGLFVVSLLGAVVVWTLLVAAVWMVARPLIGGALFAVALAAIFLAVRHIRRGAARRRAQPKAA